MNTSAHTHEGLKFDEYDFLPARKNKYWQLISDLSDRMGQFFANAMAVRRERHELAKLSNRKPYDNGQDRYEVESAINRWFCDTDEVHNSEWDI